MRFTKELIDAAGHPWLPIEVINRAMDTLTGQRVATVRAADFIHSKLAWKLATLRQSYTYRLVDLGDATIEQWQQGNTLVSIVLARSFFETVAVAHWAVLGVERLAKDGDAAGLDEHVTQALFGAKDPYWQIADAAPAINVLTALEHMSKEMPEARERYERISDLAHPNAQGTFHFYGDPDRQRLAMNFSRDKRGRKEVLSHIVLFMLGAPWAVHKLGQLDALISPAAEMRL